MEVWLLDEVGATVGQGVVLGQLVAGRHLVGAVKQLQVNWPQELLNYLARFRLDVP